MNQLCNYIDIAPLSSVESINGQQVTFKTGKSFDRITSEVTPEWTENPSRSDAGTMYKQTFRMVADKLTDQLKQRYPVNLKVVAMLYDDNGSHLMGNHNQPARITIIPNPDTDSIQLSRDTTQQIY